mmetsp:Transcript_26114/g.58866  ORF Transcript_26114/g.58866 Transcript_26114/m.58866 type:complete len:84 (+) Transcript_26114:538-789(+)
MKARQGEAEESQRFPPPLRDSAGRWVMGVFLATLKVSRMLFAGGRNEYRARAKKHTGSSFGRFVRYLGTEQQVKVKHSPDTDK